MKDRGRTPLREIPFRPLPLLSGSHTQTILGSTLPSFGEPPSETRLVALEDGDRLAMEVSTPPGWRPDARTVVFIHGLCGCHRSAYLIRLARQLYRRGVRAARLNLRGCGSGRGLARRTYHSGQSGDVLAALAALGADAPESPADLVGFSLGGNIALKLAGELGPRGPALLRRVIAICPPADLLSCSQRIQRPENRLYDRWFVRFLLQDIAHRHACFTDLPPAALPSRVTLFELDDLYTAPRSGFSGALDYYARASAAPLAPRIETRCRILFSEDDPLIDAGAFDRYSLPPNVEITRTRRGGHMGFLGLPGSAGGFRWMDAQVLAWLDEP